jgi:hypothetical protein
MKVLHLPTTVGGNAHALSRGERALGLESEVLASTRNWLDYPADINLDLHEVRSNAAKMLRLVAAFARVRNRYDVFHFNGGSSLIFSAPRGIIHWDLPFYPKRSRLFVTYNGCDARQKFPTMRRLAVAACHDPRCWHGMCNFGAYDERRRDGIAKMSRHVRHLWAVNPDLLHFLPPEKSSFLPYAVGGEGIEHSPPRFGRRLVVCHAPTNREAKGTAFILSALDRLARSHPGRFEVRLIERMPHREALAAYRDADLVIDQVLVGWYGALAVEAMRMGKPVVARVNPDDLHFLPPRMASDVLETVINAEPASLYDVLVRCVEDERFLRQRAQAGNDYATRWHDPRYVAELTREKYEAA